MQKLWSSAKLEYKCALSAMIITCACDTADWTDRVVSTERRSQFMCGARKRLRMALCHYT